MDTINQILNVNFIYVAGFRGRGVVSKTIKFVEGLFSAYADFTHVGILIHSSQLNQELRDENCIQIGEWICFESTLSGKWNDDVKNSCNKTFFGVQGRKLSELINSYNGYEGYLCIARLLIHQKPFELNINLKKHLNKKYDYNFLNLLTIHTIEKKQLSLVMNNICSFFGVAPTEKMFCSEFVFKFLNDCKLIPNKYINKHPKNISPSFIITEIIQKTFIFTTRPH